jgi:DNA-binding transcriptional LysR family regulator
MNGNDTHDGTALIVRFDERILNGIGVLAAVVRSGSFAAAATALNMSQPGVSRSIARLEGRLGIRLFERTTRKVSLTDEGRRFHQHILPLLEGLEDAAASAAQGKAMVRGHLRVNIDPYFSQLLIGPWLRSFLREYPELKLELMTCNRLGDLVTEGYDLAIRFGGLRPSSLVARKLLDTRILTVASPAYLKRRGIPKNLDELRTGRHVLIDFRDPETGRPFEWEFRLKQEEITVSTDAQLLLNDVATMHSACLAGYGIAQVMELGVEALVANGRLIKLFPGYEDEHFPLYAYYPSRHLLPSKTRAFLDFVLQIVGASHRVKQSAIR